MSNFASSSSSSSSPRAVLRKPCCKEVLFDRICKSAVVGANQLDFYSLSLKEFYFHGEYDQFLTIVTHRYADRAYVYIQYEFPLLTTTSGVSSKIFSVNYSRTDMKVTVIEYDEETFRHERKRLYDEHVDRQEAINERIEETEIEVNIAESEETLALYDISRRHFDFSPTTPEEFKNQPIFLYRSPRLHNITVLPGYSAFTVNGHYFAYLENDDLNSSYEPVLNILEIWSWKRLFETWERRKHFMLFLAGYGLLTSMRRNVSVNSVEMGFEEKAVVMMNMQESEECVRIQTLLFRVLHCPNLLQQIVFYL
jgi:hypothetical protein